MEREWLDRLATGTVTVAPFLALVYAVWHSWQGLLRWSDVVIFVVAYVLTGLGVTVGFHRLFTHRAFKTGKPLRATLAILGSAAIEGPITAWVADHRKHHDFSDQVGDPHSPHVEHGHGFRGALRGLFHAHVGWLFIHTHRGAKERYARDLRAEPMIMTIDRLFLVWALGGLRPLLPGRLGAGRLGPRRADRAAVGRRRADARRPPRHLLHQLDLPLHRAPRLRHAGRVAQRVVAGAVHLRRVVAQQPPCLPDLGAPRPDRWQFDPSALVIRGLEKTGLAWDVVRVTPERMAEKAAAPA